jgi:hypothetical protein
MRHVRLLELHKEYGNMDTQHNGKAFNIDELEYKTDELISLMLSLCEERMRGSSAMPDARSSSLTYAALAVRDATQTFLALARIR